MEFNQQSLYSFVSDETSEANEYNWLITFGDSVTLILAFFVLFISLSSFGTVNIIARDQSIQEQMKPKVEKPSVTQQLEAEKIGSLSEKEIQKLSFSPLMQHGGDGLSTVPARGTTGETSAFVQLLNEPFNSSGSLLTPQSLTSIRTFREKTAQYDRLTLEYLVVSLGDFRHFIASRGLDDVVAIQRTADGRIVFTFDNALLFNTGTAEITTYGDEILTRVARVIKDIPNMIILESYSDGAFRNDIDIYTRWQMPLERMRRAIGLLTLRMGDDHTERFTMQVYGCESGSIQSILPAGDSSESFLHLIISPFS
ncbi:MAG: hypothetical protein KKH94_06565 [Candidatus Omnitrophica bacterium]|nr:hypothetical protein [Candidatus Omnitrophota bacterium]